MKINEIHLNPKNPRFIRDEKYDKLKINLKEFPKMMKLRPIVVDDEGMILGGNMRYRALRELGYKEIPEGWVVKASELTEEEKRRFIITDNLPYGEWDYDILGNDWELEELKDWGMELPEFDVDGTLEGGNEARIKLTEKFIVPPFSVLDTRQGYWQDRKKAWLDLGIKSEIGRNEKLLGSRLGYEVMEKNDGSIRQQQGTSIFNPVLTEIMYKWFCVDNGKILDLFAGGSVRGIVAGYLGYHYTGIELRSEQVEANTIQSNRILKDKQDVEWIVGDSANVKQLVEDKKYDFIFSCPPYYDLEIYSDLEGELSAIGTYEEFIKQYRYIISESVNLLNDNRFACFVVGDIRDKEGNYRNFVSDTISAFQDAGMKLYNEAILITAIGSLAIRIGKQFGSYRKLGKTHQNVLVFYKGDIKSIKQNYQEIKIDNIESIAEEFNGIEEEKL
jgi:16S rRNA G966 N2-methylase RsmD